MSEPVTKFDTFQLLAQNPKPEEPKPRHKIRDNSILDHVGLELRLCASVVPGSLSIDEAKMASLYLYAADGAGFLQEQRC
jgi:hypothetical protein